MKTSIILVAALAATATLAARSPKAANETAEAGNAIAGDMNATMGAASNTVDAGMNAVSGVADNAMDSVGNAASAVGNTATSAADKLKAATGHLMKPKP